MLPQWAAAPGLHTRPKPNLSPRNRKRSNVNWQQRLLTLAWSISICGLQDMLYAQPPSSEHVYKQVADRSLKIFVTQPEDWQSTDQRPAVVFFHGGGWVGGAPGQFDEHATYLATRGMVCFQVEYRLLDKQQKLPPTDCVQDAKSAMRWVRSRSKQFGIDPDRIASGGGSAGGHLAAFVGMVDGGDAPEDDVAVSAKSNAMLLFNPVYDNGPGGWGTARVGQRFQEFSPFHNISADDPPSIVFLGTQDALIPVATAESFRDRCLELGVNSELHTYAGQSHGFFNTNRDGGRWFRKTLLATDQFLTKLGWLEGPATISLLCENVVLISLDGLRREEVFTGVDERLLLPDLGVKDLGAYETRYVRDTPEERRQCLLPFLWEHVAEGAWIAGNPEQDSTVQVNNGRYFSYPGYNEILTGFADPKIDSNAKQYNENVTVLEYLQQQPDLAGSVAAYCSWDVFPFIINDRRSGIAVNAGWMPLTVGHPERLAALNFAAENLFHEWQGVRYDVFTASGALEAMRAVQPRVLYVSLGETDDWAHAGRYDRYLDSAQQNDLFIQRLWDAAQELEAYRGTTAFIITTDHGRGDGREGWKNHGDKLPGSEFIWIAAFGAGISTAGEDRGGSYQQAQIAATVAQLLGHNFAASDPRIAPALPIVAQ